MKSRRETIRLVSVLAVALAAISQSASQVAPGTASAGADHSFIISTPATAWTDTGLDLGTGDVVQISASEAGCGQPAGGGERTLPLPSAPPGSLIARLHAQGAAPLPAENGKAIPIEEPSHLYLGVNGGNCAGSLQVKVHIVPAAAASSATPAGTGVPTSPKISSRNSPPPRRLGCPGSSARALRRPRHRVPPPPCRPRPRAQPAPRRPRPPRFPTRPWTLASENISMPCPAGSRTRSTTRVTW
jgi:hypothetical protein